MNLKKRGEASGCYVYIYNEMCWFVLFYFLYFLLGLKGPWNGGWPYSTFLKHLLWENNKGSFTLLKKKIMIIILILIMTMSFVVD
jgi:hypothetical protein